MKKKLKSKKAYTFTELLTAVAILSLICACVVTGMNTAIRAYGDMMFRSESSLLISTVNESVKDILLYAEDVKTSGSSPAGYTDKPAETFSSLQSYTAGERSYYKYGINEGKLYSDGRRLVMESSEWTGARVLTGEGIYAKHLAITEFNLYYDAADGMFRFFYTVTDERNQSRSRSSGEIYISSIIPR